MPKPPSGTTQVRETIELLSTILVENGTSLVHAEHFRLAKFDKNDAVPVLWRLLFELLYFCQFGGIDLAAIQARSYLSTEERCVYVKRGLQERGYLSRVFASLPNDASAGSRELLLAFAWLFCTEDITDKFMNKCTSPLEEDVHFLHQDQLSSIESSVAKPSVQRSISDPGSSVRNLLMLNGKLRLNLRRLYALQQEEARLTYKVHNATSGVSLSPELNHLTLTEVHLLRHPEKLKKMLFLLEKDNERLEHLLSWKEQEDVFWTWMDSVLQLKKKEATNAPSVDKSDETSLVYLTVMPSIKQDIQHCRQQLIDAILSYESIIEGLEDLWHSKKFEVSSLELDNLLTLINMEISLQKANLIMIKPRSSSCTKRLPKFILQKPCNKTKRSNLSRERGDPGLSPPTDIQSYTAELHNQISKLESEISKMQSDCRLELDLLAQKIPSAVCIQPLALQKRLAR
ncbi:tubulin epsilon and delta complex protein 1-like [Gigantopelta aegis]|uniref:tubulin epsilon and delta complex protein 1-like n=1 Tax=Gigantopelta aegis TaxID=1735272 RepID=UPI001B88ADA5|nr:tubulin epsilon and delta complex protein 1-like [Gigantopelta aegis]